MKRQAAALPACPDLAHTLRQVGSAIGRRVLHRYVGFWEQMYPAQIGMLDAPMPPAHLRARIGSSTSIGSFLSIGKNAYQTIEHTLQQHNKPLDNCRTILDFGCGCGRTLLWFAQHPAALSLYGTDIDAGAIEWCRQHFDFAEFGTNRALPPSRYAAEQFDLIYTISVFTHLNEQQQFAWLQEFQRILQPGGIALITVLGRDVWQHLPPHHVATMEQKGFLFVGLEPTSDLFPQSYQTTYHSRDYIFTHYAAYFDILDYVPRGVNNHQDLLVLRKRG
jgi:ubiquinone/menaquinone biosynthesis C-methylase UbiE